MLVVARCKTLLQVILGAECLWLRHQWRAIKFIVCLSIPHRFCPKVEHMDIYNPAHTMTGNPRLSA